MRAFAFRLQLGKALATKALQRAWPGVVWSPLSPSGWATVPEQLPGPRWIRVRNRQCGICGSDLGYLQVRSDPRAAPAALPNASHYAFGHEVVSEVVEVGPGVAQVAVGDRVIMDTRAIGPTCLSQEIDPICRHCRAGDYALCENQSAGRHPPFTGGGWGDGYLAHESEVYRLPTDLSADQGVLLEPAAVALHAVLRRPPQPGEQVLVVGCGIVGLLTIRLAALVAPDVRITAMARYPHQAALARSLGASEVLTGGDRYAAVARLTGGRTFVGSLGNTNLIGGYDVVYDAVGSAHTVSDGLRWARAGGTLVMVGIEAKPMQVDLSPVWHQEVRLLGSFGHGLEPWQGRRVHAYELLIGWLRSGKLPTEGLITHRFPLSALRQAVSTAADKRSGAVKVVLQMAD